MSKILESYKKNKKGEIEEKYTLVNMEGKESVLIKKENYSPELEKKLLEQLKSTLTIKLNNYPNLCIDTNKKLEELIKSFTMLGLSIQVNSELLIIISAISTLKLRKTTMKKVKQLKETKKLVKYMKTK